MFEVCLHEWGLEPGYVATNWTWPKFRRMSAAMVKRKNQELEMQAKMAGAMFGAK